MEEKKSAKKEWRRRQKENGIRSRKRGRSERGSKALFG